MTTFAQPLVHANPDGWGPPPVGDADGLGLFEFAIESLDKYPLSKIGRICDFTASGQRFAEQRAAKGKGKGKGFQPLAPPAGKDEDGFALVDTRPVPGKSSGRGRGMKAKGKGRGIAANYQEGILGQKQKSPYYQNQSASGSKGKGKNKARGHLQRRGAPSFKEWSVETKTDWPVKRDIMLSTLAKLQIDSRDVKREDAMWCGQLHEYNKEFDRITVRTKKPITRFEELNFFNVSTSDDPMLPEMLQADDSVTVIATDHVLACLIAAARSVYSWDIVITKINDRLIFDKRDGSQIDFVTVNETAQEPPNNDDKDSINSPMKLGREASCINQNFSQMVLDYRRGAQQMEHPNPFEEEDEGQAASGAYRYIKFTLPGNPKDDVEFNKNPVTLIVRTEVNCKMPDTSQLVSVKALNEYDPKPTYSWVAHLDSQRGMVLGNELRNNGFKLGRWTAQAILAGCDLMKIGYATRSHPGDERNHTVLGVQTYHTDGFAEQIGMTRNNLYGILRNIIDLVMGFEDGKYLLLKDPTKSVMRVYEVPWDAFGDEGDDDEGEEEDEGDGQELDEEGNVIPQQD